MPPPKLVCRHCQSPFILRVDPAGLVEKLAALFGYHHFLCESCKQRFQFKEEGEPFTPDPSGRRKAVRVVVQIQVTYESNEFSGEGTLTDMSMHGCSLVAKQPLRTGLVIRLNLPASAGQKPTQQLATVMGVNGTRAGLKFLAYSSQEKDVLAQTVTRSVRIFASK